MFCGFEKYEINKYKYNFNVFKWKKFTNLHVKSTKL